MSQEIMSQFSAEMKRWVISRAADRTGWSYQYSDDTKKKKHGDLTSRITKKIVPKSRIIVKKFLMMRERKIYC